MKSSHASKMILDAYWCADGVWRVPPASINAARARDGIDPLPGPDFKFIGATFDFRNYGGTFDIHNYEDLLKEILRNGPHTTST